jgi:hypothetical protein
MAQHPSDRGDPRPWRVLDCPTKEKQNKEAGRERFENQTSLLSSPSRSGQSPQGLCCGVLGS